MALKQKLQFWLAGLRFLAHVHKILPFARMSPAILLQRRARRFPLDTALLFEDRAYSWSELDQHVNRYANWLTGQGLVRGDVVALMMDNRPEFLMIVMAFSRVGIYGALLNTSLRDQALAHAIGVAGCRGIIAGSEYADVVKALGDDERPDHVWIQVDGDNDDGGINDAVASSPAAAPAGAVRPRNTDPFCYIYTSGTTGLPKAAVVTNQRMLGANFIFGTMMHRSRRGDVIYVTLPVYHTNAMSIGWGAALATGAAIALRRKFSVSQFWTDVSRYRATSFVYIGELCRYLLNAEPHPDETNHRLRVAVGNGMRPEVWGPFQERFNVPVVREFYGSTEGNAPALNFEGRPGMIGRIGRGREVVACDPESGELIRDRSGFARRIAAGETGLLLGRISRFMRFEGYVDKRASQSKVLHDVFRSGDRYFNSGDLVQLHNGGWLSFADRLGDTYRWKGENVSTGEVAQILGTVAGVEETTVFGVPVPNADGKAGMAAVVPGAGFDLGGFTGDVNQRLAPFQRPVFVRLVQGSMKITGTFKHQKNEYSRDGFDPTVVSDPLYVLSRGEYQPLSAAVFEQIQAGELPLG